MLINLQRVDSQPGRNSLLIHMKFSKFVKGDYAQKISEAIDDGYLFN